MTEETINPIEAALAELDDTFQILAGGAIKASDRLNEIKDILKVNAGNVAQVNSYAMSAVLAMPVPETVVWPAKKDQPTTMLDLATFLLEANTYAEELAKDMRSDLLKAQVKSADNSEALKEEFKTQKGVVEAFKTLATTMPGFPEAGVTIANSLTVPDLRGGSSASTRGLKTGGVVYGYTENGTKNDIGPSQNKFSSTAYYYSKRFTEDGSTMSTDDWRSFLKTSIGAEFKGDQEPWSVSNSDGSYTAWCEHRMAE